MTTTYTRIDEDTIEQITTLDPIINRLKQSEMQKAIDDIQKRLDEIPKPKQYHIGATYEEKKATDEWNIKNSNKFTKERMQESINSSTVFLEIIKAVKAVKAVK